MKDESMYLGLDRDSGREDIAATPATRSDAEQALRDLASQSTDEVGTSDSQDDCPHGCPPGVCMGDAIEAAVTEATAKGIKPDSPEFGAILERVFSEQNPDSGVKITFLGSHTVDEEMPDELKAKLGDLGLDLFGGKIDVLGSSPTPDPVPMFTKEMLDELILALPPVPDPYGIFKPRFDSLLPMPLPLPPLLSLPSTRLLSEPMTSTIGGKPKELPGLDELLGAVFGTPQGERLKSMEDDGEDLEQERRAVVQDLAAAAADAAGFLDTDAGEDMAAALRDIASLARDTYED